ncbi:MAG: 4-hydroxy-tetrahydrodipicolinate synthase [Deltaproteobacteria bacterium GWC2_65_14]|nr:MAG: 4-hydroxy-tetrahydrodipicolinate synthase [Deltaproteobacteria bacterium GWC2_65_14]
MFQGAIVATVTPFRNGKVDRAALRKLVRFQIESGTDGIVPCGTTGESATLSFEEHERVIDTVIDAAGGKVPVIAGTGSNNTREAILLTRYARKAGASGALVITPYYNKPTQEGLYRHFRAVAESADIPIILYNVPGRTGVNMTAATVARLAEIPNIVGVKEASGNLNQICDILRETPKKFCVLSGDDFLYFPMLALGAKGVISVTSNVAPRAMADLYDAYVIGEISRAREIHYRLWPLFNACFIETNPIPAKTALAMMGRIREEFRLPLCPMSDANRKVLAKVLSDLRLV